MIMKAQKRIFTRFLHTYIILIITLATACSKVENNYTASKDDEFLQKVHKELYSSTDSIIYLIEHYNTEDSIMYYKLNNLLSRAYYIKGDINKAHELNKRTIFYGKNNSSTDDLNAVLADAYNNEGVYYSYSMNNKMDAIENFKTAYELLNKDPSNNYRKITDISINIADCYHMSGEYSMASYWYRKTLLFTDSLELKGFEMPIYSGLAKLYLDLNNFSLSNQYFNLAEDYIDSCTDYEKFFFFNSRGNYYFFTKKYEDALPWFFKAYNIIDEDFCRITSSCNIGEVYLYMNNIDSAEKYINKAVGISKKIGDRSTQYYIKGLVIQLEIMKNNIDKAENLINELNSKFNFVSPEYIYLQNKRMKMLYEAKGEYKKAYFYNQKMEEYDDSLRNMKIINMVSENDLRYKNDTTIVNKNKKIELSEKKIIKMRFILTVSILAIILLIVSFALIYTLNQKKQEQKHRAMLATLNQLKMESVKSRISPHYIFNVINALMPGLRNHQELQYPIRCMVRLLRNGLSAGNNTTVELAKEIEYVNDYVMLYRLYKENIPEINWNIDSDINPETLIIPTMIIQIPVENAVKYAFVDIENPELSIDIRNNSGTEIIVKDNGIGFDYEKVKNNTEKQETNEKGTGTGLKAINEMLNLFNMNKKNKISFEILHSETGKGTKIRIFIPEDFNYDIL